MGQDEFKTKLVSAVSQYTLFLDEPEAEKPTMLVFGPSGSGKTFAIELIVKAAGLPYTIANGASLSPPGVKGVTLHDIITQHWLEHETDEGIIFVDEIDKWSIGVADSEEGQYKRAMQGELLRYMHDDSVSFMDDAKDINEMKGIIFETKNTLFILAGAFVGLDSLIRNRLHNSYFPKEEAWAHAVQSDFTRFGMIDELVNRISTLAWTKPLTATEIRKVLEIQERPRWEQRFRAIGCHLDLQDGALGRCAQSAFDQQTGARGGAAMLRRSMDSMFVEASRLHLDELEVDAAAVESGHFNVQVAV